MYFNDKNEDTNIDSEFKEKGKFNFDFSEIGLKTILIGIGIIIAIIIAIVVIVSTTGKGPKYTIELTGEDKIIIGLNKEYVELGYKAYDKKKKDVSGQVKVTHNVDTSKAGEYEVLYSIGEVKKVRIVTVAELAEETFIRLKGKVNAMYLVVGEEYIEPGFDVYDNIDEDLNSKVKITGKVDTSKAGTYRLTYSVVNSRNVTATATRTVIVEEKKQK